MARHTQQHSRYCFALPLAAMPILVLGCANRNTASPHREPDRPAVRDEVARILDAQAEAWNRGDLEAFMQHYWKSDQLTFSSGGKTIHGWAATLDRYKQRYAPPEKMGRLRFDIDLVRPLGETAALALGCWHLTIGDQTPHGNFSLVFERIDGRWCIIHDHTSLVATPDSPTPDEK